MAEFIGQDAQRLTLTAALTGRIDPLFRWSPREIFGKFSRGEVVPHLVSLTPGLAMSARYIRSIQIAPL